MVIENTVNGILYSTDKDKLQVAYIHNYLSRDSYWSPNIPLHIVEQSIEGSICIGLYDGGQQIGFARIITDEATFAYLADVFVDEAYRGRGYSKELMRFIMELPFTRIIRGFMLGTKDAHGLYEQFDFKPLPEPGRYMIRKTFTSY